MGNRHGLKGIPGGSVEVPTAGGPKVGPIVTSGELPRALLVATAELHKDTNIEAPKVVYFGPDGLPKIKVEPTRRETPLTPPRETIWEPLKISYNGDGGEAHGQYLEKRMHFSPW